MVSAAAQIKFDEFLKVDIRVGTIVEARVFSEARKPAFILMIDFGDDIGIKKSSAQIAEHYSPDVLIGKQVMAVVNFAPRQIGPIKSQVLTLGFEVLTLGFADTEGAIILAAPDKKVPNGQRLN